MATTKQLLGYRGYEEISVFFYDKSILGKYKENKHKNGIEH